MLVIKARHKTTGVIYQFTPSEWYIEQQTGNYDYLGTVYVAEPAAPVAPKTTVKRGCGCANKVKK